MRLRGGAITENPDSVTFKHAPLSYFAIDKLTPKGPRKNADVGAPEDATRSLVKSKASVGSWSCTEGGWDSPALRGTTEVFYVLKGEGCVTDLDGMKHEFKAGDTVILPKNWSGRWDVMKAIHKVWVVHDHADVEGLSTPIRAVVVPLEDLKAGKTVYEVGPTAVSGWLCTPGGSGWADTKSATECFHVLEGVFFVTNADGNARRCVSGDTVVVPKGWSGHWDIIEPVKTIKVQVMD